MIFAIDIGNTNIVAGCIDKEKTYFIERLSTVRTKTELEYAVDIKTLLDIYHIKKNDIEGCIISSVVPQITNPAHWGQTWWQMLWQGLQNIRCLWPLSIWALPVQ